MTIDTKAHPEFLTIAARPHPAWEKIGYTREGGWRGQDAVSEAMTEAGMNYTLQKVQPTIDFQGASIPYGNKFAVVRPALAGKDNKPRVVGMVSRSYPLVQPMSLAEVINPLATRWSVIAVGALQHGRKTFVALDMGQDKLTLNGRDDDFRDTVWVLEDHGGGGAIKFFYGRLRMFCQNQFPSFIAALSGKNAGTAKKKGLLQASGLLSIPHTGDPLKLLEYRTQIEIALMNQREAADAQLRSMVAFGMTEKAMDYVLETAYPDPGRPSTQKTVDEIGRLDTPDGDRAYKLIEADYDEAGEDWEKRRDRAVAKREEVKIAYNAFNEQFPEWSETGYALWNGLTERSDWGGNRSDGVAASVLFGERAKEKTRGLAALLTVAGY